MDNNSFKNKVIVITGGNRGIGKAVALETAKRGAKIVLSCRDDKAAEDALIKINEDIGSEGICVKGDLSIEKNCKNLIDKTVETFGRIDGLFNYAGILPASALIETDEKLFDDVFAINIKAPFFVCKYAVKVMQKQKSGSIVNTGSPHAWGGEPDRAAYAVSKGALLTLTKHIANNYAKDHVRCNWITMGWVRTDGELALRKEENRPDDWLDKESRKVIPMGRMQTIEDHVNGILYLLSDSSSQVTGTEIHFTGGYFPKPPMGIIE